MMITPLRWLFSLGAWLAFTAAVSLIAAVRGQRRKTFSIQKVGGGGD